MREAGRPVSRLPVPSRGSAERTGRQACRGGGRQPPADTPPPSSQQLPDRLGRPLRKRSASAAARGCRGAFQRGKSRPEAGGLCACQDRAEASGRLRGQGTLPGGWQARVQGCLRLRGWRRRRRGPPSTASHPAPALPPPPRPRTITVTLRFWLQPEGWTGQCWLVPAPEPPGRRCSDNRPSIKHSKSEGWPEIKFTNTNS